MRYIKKIGAAIAEAQIPPRKSSAYYAAAGYLPYTGTLPLSRLDVVGDAVVELPEPPPNVPVIRYSKYKIVELLGDQWSAFKSRIESAGYLELWNAAKELSSDDENFAYFLGTLNDTERSMLDQCKTMEV